MAIVMHRTKGVSGPFFQPLGGGMAVKGSGNYFGIGGPGSGPKPRFGQVLDGSTVEILFSQCVSISAATGIEVEVNGAWAEVVAVSEFSETVWRFTPAVVIEPGDVVRWRYIGGSGTILGCDDSEDIGDQTVEVTNPLVLPGDYVLLEVGGVSVILLEDASVSPDDGLALENAP
jgi:hypothetical protein